jgi:hypothetical protein
MVPDLVHQENGAEAGDGLDAQKPQKLFQVGFVDDDFAGWLACRNGLDSAFVEGLEKAHFGDGVFFGTGERTAVLSSPGFESGLVDEDLEGKSGVAVSGNDVSELATWAGAAVGTIPFEEIILIDVAVGGGIALDAANGIGTSHRRIIGARALEEVNE